MPHNPMKTSRFDYALPKELIAQTPSEPRDHSRLMTLGRRSGEIAHYRFCDLPNLLNEGDLLVFNDSRVFPARLRGRADPSGGRIELLLLTRLASGVWRALVRPGRRLRQDSRFTVSDPNADNADSQSANAAAARATGKIVSVEPSGSRIVRFDTEPDLDAIGVVPLPPYIHETPDDIERYQTVYSRAVGSVAAPTAGLHFTQRLLDDLEAKGIRRAFVTLHVGWDSFRPVASDDVAAHRMHSERWELSAAAAAINSAWSEGRRIISVGTTAVRLLENAALLESDQSRLARLARLVSPGAGDVDLFITPGFRFQVIDGLITNFHLPKSTLLMLVSAFSGRENILNAYARAVEERYRFYSFGDAMLIL